MTRWLKFIPFIALLAFASLKIRNRLVMPDLPLAQTRLIKEDGSQLKPAEINKKYLLISCFQSWCGDCIREAPSLAALQEFAGNDKLEILLISDEEWEKINRFGRHLEKPLPLYQTQKSFDELGIRVYPSTWLLGPDRKILLAKLEGYNWNSTEVRNLIR